MRKAAGKLLSRLPVEMSVLLVRDLLKVHPPFMADPNCAAFRRKFGLLNSAQFHQGYEQGFN